MGCISAGLIRGKFIISAAEKVSTEMDFPQRWWSTRSWAWCCWSFPCSDGSGSRTRGRLVKDRGGISSKNSISCGELRFPGVQAEAGVCQELSAGTAHSVLECDLNSAVTTMRVLDWDVGAFHVVHIPLFPGRTWGSQDLSWNDPGWKNPCVILHPQHAHELRANKRAVSGHCWQRTWDKYCNQNCLTISPFSPLFSVRWSEITVNEWVFCA